MANPFSLRIDNALRTRLEKAAKTEERSLSYIAQKAIADYLDDRDFKHREIMRAYHDAQGGEALPDHEVTKWVESWGTENEERAPVPRRKPE